MSEQRLIDANALLMHECEADKMGAMLVVGKGYILDAPTVPAEIVCRCKDCVHSQYDALLGGYWCNGKNHSGLWFCADCERRESEDG